MNEPDNRVPGHAQHPEREGSSLTAPDDMVGVNRRQQSESARRDQPSPDAPMRIHNERDETAGSQTDEQAPEQVLRRSRGGEVPVIRQAHDDVAHGLQDTDLYGSGNLASPDDKGRRPDASVDRRDDSSDVLRSGNDVRTD